MISSSQWSSLLHYRRSDFSNPDNLDFSVVQGADRLTSILGVKGRVLSDWRPFSPSNPNSQHALGKAIDLEFPGLEPLDTLAKIESSKLFSGFGMYINEVGAVSYHVDTRTNRTVDAPATWGGIITRPMDDTTGQHVKRIAYVALSKVADMVKKKSGPVLAVFLLIWLGWILTRRS